jgi:hypothetical protein
LKGKKPVESSSSQRKNPTRRLQRPVIRNRKS